jgi:PAS domain S-box-containing protein
MLESGFSASLTPVQHLEVPVGGQALHLDSLEKAALTTLLETSPDGLLVFSSEHRCLYANRTACEICARPLEELLNQGMLFLFPLKEQKVPMQLGMHADRWESVLVRPSGEKREIECSYTAIVNAGKRLHAVRIRDISPLLQLERKVEVLTQFATNMAYADSLEAILNALARSVVCATGIMACLIPLLDGTPPQFRVVGSHGLPAGYAAGVGRLVQAGTYLPSLQAFKERRTVVAHGVRQSNLADPRWALVHEYLQQSEWDTVACIPLVYRGVSLGVFTVYYPAGPGPSESEIAFFSAIADQAAVAVENARLLVEAQAKAALEERQRLARELHDSVSQAIYGITLGAQAARAGLDSDQQRAIESLDYVLSLAKACHAEMRSLIFALRPESLATEGLVVALQRHAAAICARHELRVEAVLCAEPDDLPFEVKEALYRIVQEALNNIVKHAHAQCVVLSLRYGISNSSIVLQVSDDGVGFETSRSYPEHLGLQSMRERTTRLGGTLDMQSAPGGGTSVLVSIPMTRA